MFSHHYTPKLSRCLFCLVVGALACGLMCPSSEAQSIDNQVHVVPRVAPRPQPNVNDPALDTHTKPLRANANLVLVPVMVTDPDDRLVTGLEKKDFAVYEKKQKEAIASFSCEDAPISLGIILDMSGSMSDKIDKAREAVVEFLQTANPKDEFFIIGFSDKPTLITDFTSRVDDAQSQLVMAAGKGRTALLDAIYLGIEKMHHARHHRKALLIISDGGDNNSRYTEDEVKTMVEEADTQIYGIGIFDSSPKTPEEQEGPTLLSDITEATGGRTFTLDDPSELPDVATKIGTELRNEYVIGYVPAALVKDGKWHKITVKLKPPKGLPRLTLYAKKGYYAPSE